MELFLQLFPINHGPKTLKVINSLQILSRNNKN